MSKHVLIVWECDRCPQVMAQTYTRRPDQVSVDDAYPPAPFAWYRDPHVPEAVYVLCEIHASEYREQKATQAAEEVLGIAVSEDLGLEERAP